MEDFEAKNTREMLKVRNFLVEQSEKCRAVKRKARWLMFVWFWHPSKYKRVKAIYEDARQAELIYSSGVDVLNGHSGMNPTRMV